MHNPQAETDNALILSQIPLPKIFEGFRAIIREEIRSQQKKELQEKLLSPAETCALFSPKISKSTLESWSAQGLLQKHYMGKNVYYKYSQVMASLTTLVRYKTKKG